jgi:hypothetical protein
MIIIAVVFLAIIGFPLLVFVTFLRNGLLPAKMEKAFWSLVAELPKKQAKVCLQNHNHVDRLQ